MKNNTAKAAPVDAKMKLRYLRLEENYCPKSLDDTAEISDRAMPICKEPQRLTSRTELKLCGNAIFSIKDQHGCVIQEASLNFTPEEVAAIEAIAKKAMQRVAKDVGGSNA